MQHVEKHFHRVKDLRLEETIDVKHIATEDQIADLLIEPVMRQAMKELRPEMLVDPRRQFDSQLQLIDTSRKKLTSFSTFVWVSSNTNNMHDMNFKINCGNNKTFLIWRLCKKPKL